MRHLYTLLIAGLFSTSLLAQTYPLVQVTDINTVTPSQLANCDDTSAYHLDTVTVVCYVVTAGHLAEVASSSINGAGGVRPFIFVNDTANNGQVGPYTGLEVMGVNWGSSQATAGFIDLIEGDLVEITGVVGMFDNATQFQPLDNNSINILSSSYPSFTPAQINVGDLNDQNQVNQLETGEQWEASFVEVRNVTVTSVNQFGSGTNARMEFTVSDSAGNSMQVYDFFVAQRLPSWNTMNPNSLYSNGILNPPSVGTYYTSLKGVIEHSGNGCTGGTGQGYRLHPFDSTHYEVGEAFPSFVDVSNRPEVPSSNTAVTVDAEVIDADGIVDSVHIFWATNTTTPVSAFTQDTMTQTAGNIYSATIPGQPNNSTIYYYIRAVDDNGNISYYPGNPMGQDPNLATIFVRDNGLTIMDIQTPSGSGDASPFAGDSVTVRGFVTSGLSGCDLGYVYIQDTAASEYAGIRVTGGLALAGLARNEYVEIRGEVQESFGFTQLNAGNITSLGTGYEVEPIELDPSSASDMAEFEKYESMLVTYRDPNGGPLYVTEPDLGFGEYAISSDQNPASADNERRVLAGRQAGTNAQSSLHVQLVSDSSYANQDGTMAYPPIVTDQNITMDAMTGIVWYSFGNFKLTPRNNFDIENLSEELDTTGCQPPIFSAKEISSTGDVQVYPNPATDFFTVEASTAEIKATIYDMKGVAVGTQENRGAGKIKFDTRNLQPGLYILKVTGSSNATMGTYKVIITQ